MNSEEVWTIIVFGFIGYLTTSALIRLFKKKINESNDNEEKNNSYKKHDDFESGHENKSNKTWYEVLEVSQQSSLSEIKDAYRKKISMYHPDKVSDMGPEINEIAQIKSKEINSAYEEAVKIKS